MSLAAESTLMVKTIYRPVKVVRLVESVRRAYPDMASIIVLDDGPDGWHPDAGRLHSQGAELHTFPEDVGIGLCYNTALQELIDTPYTILCDDDDLFDDTDIEQWADWLVADCDLIGGGVYNNYRQLASTFVGRITWRDTPEGKEVWLRRFRPQPEGPVECDYCPNFFAAHTDALRRVPWDEKLKVCRHADWFLMAQREGLRCMYHPGVQIIHDHASEPHDPPQYRHLRSGRYQQFVRMFEAKWGLRDRGLHE
jgi:hypothetical protein